MNPQILSGYKETCLAVEVVDALFSNKIMVLVF
jgi:hypothetical protein